MDNPEKHLHIKRNKDENKKLKSNILPRQATNRAENINDAIRVRGGGEINVIDAFTTHFRLKLDRLLADISNKQIIYARNAKVFSERNRSTHFPGKLIVPIQVYPIARNGSKKCRRRCLIATSISGACYRMAGKYFQRKFTACRCDN